MNKMSGWSYLYTLCSYDSRSMKSVPSHSARILGRMASEEQIANVLLMVYYIAQIYADCLYRFALIDCQAGFRGHVYPSITRRPCVRA